MRCKSIVDRIMDKIPPNRRKICEATEGCACMGCIHGEVNKEEFEEWSKRHNFCDKCRRLDVLLTGWIKCTERLPESGIDVLAFTEEKWIIMAIYGQNKWREQPDNERVIDMNVTHWQPLPEPPNEQDDGE